MCLRQWTHLYSWERITQTILNSIKNTGKDLALKQMFDISEQLILEQSDENFGVSQNSWESSPGKQLSLVNDEEVISLSHAKVYVFSDSVLCLRKMNQNPVSKYCLGATVGMVQRFTSSQHRILDTIDGEPMEFDWNITPGFTSLELVREVRNFMNKTSEPEQFQGRIIFLSMFNDMIWRSKDTETECIANSTLVSLFAEKKISSRTLVILRTWLRNKVVFHLQRKTTRRMGQSR